MERLFVDMDGTLAVWRTDISSPEELYRKNYFKDLAPQQNVVNAIKNIINESEMEVYILSAYLSDSKYALKEKKEWIQNYIPEISKDKQIFVPIGKSKVEYLKEIGINVTYKDFLLDDYTLNLNEWETKGTGIKLINPINNKNATWKGARVHYESDTLENDILNVIYQEQNKIRLTYTDEMQKQDELVKSNQQNVEVLRELFTLILNETTNKGYVCQYSIVEQKNQVECVIFDNDKIYKGGTVRVFDDCKSLINYIENECLNKIFLTESNEKNKEKLAKKNKFIGKIN